MSVVENFFEKFEKGELREVEKVVEINSDGAVTLADPEKVTVDDLVDIESVVAVEVSTDSGDTYQSFEEGSVGATNAATRILGVEGVPSSADGEGNVVDLTYYDGSGSAYDGTDTTSDNLVNRVKIIARGY